MLGPTSGPGQPCASLELILRLRSPRSPRVTAGVFERVGNNSACKFNLMLKLSQRKDLMLLEVKMCVFEPAILEWGYDMSCKK